VAGRPTCVAGNRACRRPFRPPSRLWPFVRAGNRAPADGLSGGRPTDHSRSSRVFLHLRVSLATRSQGCEIRRSALAFVGRPFRLKPAFSRLPRNPERISRASPRKLLRDTKPEKIRRVPRRRAEARRRLNACPTWAFGLHVINGQSPEAAFQGRRPTDHSRSSQRFFRLRVRRHLAAKPENSPPIGNGGLKGRLQARLPATRKAKADWRGAPPKGMKTRKGQLPIGRRMPSGPTCGRASTRFSTLPHSAACSVRN